MVCLKLVGVLTLNLLLQAVSGVTSDTDHSRWIRSANVFRYRDYAAVSLTLQSTSYSSGWSQPNVIRFNNPLCSQPSSTYGQARYQSRTRPPVNLNWLPKPLAYKSSAYFPVLTDVDLSRCFVRFTETRLTDIEAMFSANTSNIEECLSMCLAGTFNNYPQPCASAVFHPNNRRCELFNTTGRSDIATVTMQYGYDYYEPVKN